MLLEKHAWISAGLIWRPYASDSGTKGDLEHSKSDTLESRPTIINLFELWEDGSHLLRVSHRSQLLFPWGPSDSVCMVKISRFTIAERCSAQRGPPRRRINHKEWLPDLLVGRDPMPSRVERFFLAESVVIAMRAAAMRELKTNSEVIKPTMQTILDGLRMDCHSGVYTACRCTSIQQYL